MSFTITKAIFDRSAAKMGISSTERYVLLQIASHLNEETGLCFPSLTTTAEETGFSNRTVRNSLKTLEDKGWIVVEKRNRWNGIDILPALKGRGFPLVT